MSREVITITRHKDRSGWKIILVAAVLIAFWKVILFGLFFAGCAYAGYKVRERMLETKQAKQLEHARLAARADYENAEWLANGSIEGQYHAATMPFIGPRYEHDPVYDLCYPDYNDGLRDWK